MVKIKFRSRLKVKVILIISIISCLTCFDDYAQNKPQSDCVKPTYQQIYNAMLTNDFFSMSSYIQSIGGHLEYQKDTDYISSTVNYPYKYPRKRQNVYRFCEPTDNYTLSVKQDPSDWSLSLSIEILVKSSTDFDELYNSIDKYREVYDGYKFVIFGQKDILDPGFIVSFYKNENGIGGSISFWYLRGY